MTAGRDEAHQATLELCRQRYGPAVWLARAPGRVNLIGEHTDYNDGYVLPFAIDCDVRIALRPRADGVVRLYSESFDEEASFSLDGVSPDGPGGWIGYVRGMSWGLQQDGAILAGFDGVISGNVPAGSGLSSSAATSCAAGMALCAAAGIPPDRKRLAELAQQTEHAVIGVRVGIMDPYASLCCEEGAALLLDCRTRETRSVPLNLPGYEFLIIDSRQSRELAGSAYNERRARCEAATAVLARSRPGVTALRDASLDDLDLLRGQADLETVECARHVISENQRVLDAAAAMAAGDAEQLGDLMNRSHDSLRDDYRVSSAALDFITSTARAVPGCAGSRLTGTGFGGCTISLVHQDALDEVAAVVSAAYEERFGIPPAAYPTSAASGAAICLNAG